MSEGLTQFRGPRVLAAGRHGTYTDLQTAIMGGCNCARQRMYFADLSADTKQASWASGTSALVRNERNQLILLGDSVVAADAVLGRQSMPQPQPFARRVYV